MIFTVNPSSNRALGMQSYARRLLQQAAVALPPAPSPHHPASANQRSGAGGSSTAPSSSSDSGTSSPFNVTSQFSPTMVIILVILLSAFFFMGFFAIYVRRCTSDDTFTQRGNARGGGGASRRRDVASGPQRGAVGAVGVDASLVESFPMVSYATAKRKGCNECVVCLADFERGEELKQLPKCKHVFHPGCIGMWLESHTTCPLCRRSLLNSDRWSMSWRWGGSSRGGSFSARLNDGSNSSQLRSSGDSPGLQGAGSGSSRGPEEERGDQSELGGIPGSPLLPTSAPAVLAHSRSIIQVVPGCASSCVGSEVAAENSRPGVAGMQTTSTVGTSRLGAAAEMGAVSRAMVPQGGRRRLGRSNSTGHSLRKDVMSRVAAAVAMQGGPLAECMLPNGLMSVQRSRSITRSGKEEDDEEEEVAGMVCMQAERSTAG